MIEFEPISPATGSIPVISEPPPAGQDPPEDGDTRSWWRAP